METSKATYKRPIFFILGATGSGKSLAAVKVAKTLQQRCGYEDVVVINCDVMQFYADLPIATNKASLVEMEGIPHLFMGFLSCNGLKICDPTLPYKGWEKCVPSAVDDTQPFGVYNIHTYVLDVVDFIEKFFQHHASGAVVVCGGTCYYAQALLFDNVLTLNDAEDCESALRESSVTLSLHEKEKNGDALWEELNRVDSAIAVRYHPNDTRRITRLLEVYEKTGQLPSEIYARRPEARLRFCPLSCFVLWPVIPFEALKVTLDKRVDKMVDRGLLEEILLFTKRYGDDNVDVALRKAIGFKEFLPAFHTLNGEIQVKGERQLRDSIELLKTNTRRYARQQIQWIQNRFLGRLRQSFVSSQGTRKFVCVEGLGATSEFIKRVENATLFVLQHEGWSTEGLTFPLEESGKTFFAVKQEWCSLCEMFVCDGVQKDVHMRSKRHRGAVKRALFVKEQLEKYGRVIPPKKRRIS